MSLLKKYESEVKAFLKVCHQLSAKMYVTGFGGNLAWRLEDQVILITPTMLTALTTTSDTQPVST